MSTRERTIQDQLQKEKERIAQEEITLRVKQEELAKEKIALEEERERILREDEFLKERQLVAKEIIKLEKAQILMEWRNQQEERERLIQEKILLTAEQAKVQTEACIIDSFSSLNEEDDESYCMIPLAGYLSD
jgi:hypothetical protein